MSQVWGFSKLSTDVTTYALLSRPEGSASTRNGAAAQERIARCLREIWNAMKDLGDASNGSVYFSVQHFL
jgi:hypothetical protein